MHHLTDHSSRKMKANLDDADERCNSHIYLILAKITDKSSENKNQRGATRAMGLRSERPTLETRALSQKKKQSINYSFFASQIEKIK